MAKAMKPVKIATAESNRKRERIALIETEPKEEWFIKTKTERGRSVMYLRFQVTGLNSRLYGPFSTKRQALLFLDDVLDSMADGLSDADRHCEKRIVKGLYKKVWSPIVEHPILTQLQHSR